MDPTLRTLAPSFRRYLLATNRSARTVQTYLCALDGLTHYLEAEGLPSEVRSIRRSHLEGFVAQRLETVKAATISVQYRALQQFFRWAVTEEEVPSSPMAKIRPPIVPEEPPTRHRHETMRAGRTEGSGRRPRRLRRRGSGKVAEGESRSIRSQNGSGVGSIPPGPVTASTRPWRRSW